MITNGCHSRPLAIGTTFQFLVRSKFFFGLIIAALFTVAATPPPPQVSDEDTDLQYIHIMNLIDRADALRASGKTDAAKAKDREAYKALVIFQKIHPRWNTKTVDYRLTQVTEAIEGKKAETTEPSSPTKHVTKPPAKITSSSKSTVKLLDAGSEPRIALRLHPQAHDKQTLIATVKVTMDMPAMAAAGAPNIPPINVPADVSVDSVAPNGDITFDIVLGEPALATDGGLPPKQVAAAKKAFASVKGLAVTLMMSNRGSGRVLDVKPPPGAQPDFEQGIAKMQESISTMHTASPILALPEEPVGAGAKWQVQNTVTTNGMTVDVTATYQLASVQGDHITINKTVDFAMSGSPKAGAATPTPMPMGSMNLNGKMTGSSTMDLSKLMPLQSTWDGQFGMNMGMNGTANKTQSFAMKMDVSLSLEAH